MPAVRFRGRKPAMAAAEDCNELFKGLNLDASPARIQALSWVPEWIGSLDRRQMVLATLITSSYMALLEAQATRPAMEKLRKVLEEGEDILNLSEAKESWPPPPPVDGRGVIRPELAAVDVHEALFGRAVELATERFERALAEIAIDGRLYQQVAGTLFRRLHAVMGAEYGIPLSYYRRLG